MKLHFRLLFFIFLFFSFQVLPVTQGNLYAQEVPVSEDSTEFTPHEIKKNEWFIYYKNTKKIVEGPFDTVEQTIEAWINNPKIKPQSKYYIGRNGRLFTDSPESYYRRKYEEIILKIDAQKEAEKQAEQEKSELAKKRLEEAKTEVKHNSSDEIIEDSVIQKKAKKKNKKNTGEIIEDSNVQETESLSEDQTLINANTDFLEDEEKVLSPKELKLKEKQEKAEKKALEQAEKKKQKELKKARKKNPKSEEDNEILTSEASDATSSDDITESESEKTEIVDSISLPDEEVSEPEIESEPEEEAKYFAFELPLPTQKKSDSSNSGRIQSSYLSDYIAKDMFAVPEFEESNLEQDYLGDANETDSKGVSILMKAVKEGNDWKIKTLLKSGANVNAQDNEGWTPLIYAARYQSNLSIMELLLSENADVKILNNYSLSPLVIAACFNDNPDVIKKLLSFYSPSDKEVQKAFVQLISTQTADNFSLVSKVKIFLDFGLPVNSYYDGKTPLMYACKYCTSTKTIKLLLDKKAEISVRSTEGKTAFDYAKSNKSLPKDEIFWSLNKK